MDIKIETTRKDEEITVKFFADFVILYEGSSEWLQKLRDFIDEHAI